MTASPKRQRLFAALKPGGFFVVIDHSAKAEADIFTGMSLHRVDRAVVIAAVHKAGFVLEAEDSSLRDPADTSETTFGGAQFLTARTVLRFVKP